jgi:hypothetical protein
MLKTRPAIEEINSMTEETHDLYDTETPRAAIDYAEKVRNDCLFLAGIDLLQPRRWQSYSRRLKDISCEITVNGQTRWVRCYKIGKLRTTTGPSIHAWGNEPWHYNTPPRFKDAQERYVKAAESGLKSLVRRAGGEIKRDFVPEWICKIIDAELAQMQPKELTLAA